MHLCQIKCTPYPCFDVGRHLTIWHPTQAQALWSLSVFRLSRSRISTALAQGLPLKEIMAPLLRAMAY